MELILTAIWSNTFDETNDHIQWLEHRLLLAQENHNKLNTKHPAFFIFLNQFYPRKFTGNDTYRFGLRHRWDECDEVQKVPVLIQKKKNLFDISLVSCTYTYRNLDNFRCSCHFQDQQRHYYTFGTVNINNAKKRVDRVYCNAFYSLTQMTASTSTRGIVIVTLLIP